MGGRGGSGGGQVLNVSLASTVDIHSPTNRLSNRKRTTNTTQHDRGVGRLPFLFLTFVVVVCVCGCGNTTDGEKKNPRKKKRQELVLLLLLLVWYAFGCRRCNGTTFGNPNGGVEIPILLMESWRGTES